MASQSLSPPRILSGDDLRARLCLRREHTRTRTHTECSAVTGLPLICFRFVCVMENNKTFKFNGRRGDKDGQPSSA